MAEIYTSVHMSLFSRYYSTEGRVKTNVSTIMAGIVTFSACFFQKNI